MQAACWVGRNIQTDLGGVAAHLYAEFDGYHIEIERFKQALERVCSLHPMLRLCVNAEGLQSVIPSGESLLLEIEDFRGLPEQEEARLLLVKRVEWTHQKLDLSSGQASRFSLSLRDGGKFRLHVDTDMIAIDPSSFRVLMEDLAMFYDNPDQPAPVIASYFDWCDQVRTDPYFKAARERDRIWWRSRIPHIPPAPALPINQTLPTQACSHRLAAWLQPDERQALKRLARTHRITLSNLMLGLFSLVLGRHTGDKCFRLNVPMFWRAPLVDNVERIVGDFSNVLILGVGINEAESAADLCKRLGGQLTDLLAHSAYPGVNLMRDLSRHHGATQLAPIVFTAALDIPGGELLSDRVRNALGPMNWVISQGPQVALDAQIASADGGILINWDIRLDMLPEEWVTPMFDNFVNFVREIATYPQRFDEAIHSLDEVTASSPTARMRTTDATVKIDRKNSQEKPLTSLQLAYLLGRRAELPLGGVAMQEFREYRGRMALAHLQNHLAESVQRHESLRTRIDAKRLVQYVSAEVDINLQQIDLSTVSREEALRHVENHREEFAHALFDLDRSPWAITLFRLPKDKPEEDDLIAFVRFDALILDGWSIAALMVALFEGKPAIVAETDVPLDGEDISERRKIDEAYWKTKLETVSGPLRFPWTKPLAQIGTSRYVRQSLIVAREDYTAVLKAGAKHMLFKNSTLMTLVLEVMSHWFEERSLFIGVPVAPPVSGVLCNRSSFIVVNWNAEQGNLSERANTLQNDVLEGLEHLAFSGIDITRLLVEKQGAGPVLPVVMTNGLSWPVSSQDSGMQLHSGLTQTPQVAMDIRFSINADNALVFDIDYATAAIESALVQDILRAIGKAMQAIAASGVFAISAQDIIDTTHLRLNGIEADFHCGQFLSRIATNIFDSKNTKTALISGDRHISYAELGCHVRRIMGAFMERGLSKGSVVALCMHRGPEHTAVTLACALTGVIWVPIDASSPSERQHYLLENCHPDLVVTAKREGIEHPAETPEKLLSAKPLAELPLPLDALSSSEAPAYYLYTSGTTGRPKCVVLSNKSTSNVITSTLDEWSVTHRDVFISVTPLHHDMSVFDVFGCLTAGATLVLPAIGEEKDARRWNQLVAKHKVTLWCSVPAILEMLLACRQGNELKSLRLIAQGGDYIKPAVISRLRTLLPSVRLISLGGPTETTIWSIWHEIGKDDVSLIPYGRPLPANRYFLLNGRGDHCPVGVSGRIHTAGVNVALGYLENGSLTQTDFVTIKDTNGEEIRAFRTGDYGHYRRDGIIVFDSRVNGYVKVRGVRISLPDIENELVRHPSVKHVLVVDYGEEMHGETSIGVLYVPRQEEALSGAELRKYACQCLPPSHIPTRILPVTELPLSPNGKPDRAKARSLLMESVHEQPPIPHNAFPAQETTMKKKVLEIYLDVLGQSRTHHIDGASDFISMGLRPQHLKTISARLYEEFAIVLSLPQLLRCRNVAEVEQSLNEKTLENSPDY
ncbi:non-ribosomal peptide synthetase BasA/D [Xenorhabdus kozodoii]|uniref:Non-ribosomal peptide synthetase BasA/D n=2 Tax=Xenorhabdus kozodoii TaxID=351676 RepID=A0A2D0L404_9GAMM|nr:non-ribosomal peptide synthetase BasA/D [Xenorhabdus kozodoii]